MAAVKDVVAHLEAFAPRALQENYDNSGLQSGHMNAEIKGILLTLDCTEAVVDEAIRKGCNLIISHHPLLFHGLKSITGNSYVERTLIKAIKNDVAIYAMHTNLDNVHRGVNAKICERIGLHHCRILSPGENSLSKLVTFVPPENTDRILDALYAAGAGQIGNYKNCSFQLKGKGTFLPSEGSTPYMGELNKPETADETRLEVILPTINESRVLEALQNAHPYEEVAYYISRLVNTNQEVGAGMIGELERPEEPIAFLQRLRKVMNAQVIRHTALSGKAVEKVAVCGGSGSFLLEVAAKKGADIFVSADFKYHQFFDADSRITIADIGHYESEQFTGEVFNEILSEKFTTFAIIFSKVPTNPISYLHN